jgi:hypothetical protein
MLVEDLIKRVRELVGAAAFAEIDAEILRLVELIAPHSTRTTADLLTAVGKLKLPKAKAPPKPKKNPEQLAAEKVEKARLKAEEAERKRLEKEKAKADEAERKRMEKEVAARKKLEEKIRLEEEKKAKKARESQEKLEAARVQAEEATKRVIDELKALMLSFRDTDVTKETVDQELAKLQPLKAPQLLAVAQGINAAATLTEKTPAVKIKKQITTMILRVWKTTQNVNH